jgi:hypothetical protein
MFFERQEQLKHRAITRQLHHNDLELLEQIELTLRELQKLVEDIKKLNND